MGNRPTFFTLILFSLLMLANLANAQCIAAVMDIGCDPNHDCLSITNCTGTDFTVPVTGTYCVKIKADCDPTDDCKFCQVCANVYNGATWVSGSNCHRTNCDNAPDCSFDCSGGFTLSTGITYTLYACLSPCEMPPDPRDCDNCPDDSSCKAYAAVYKQGNLKPCDL